ASPWSQLPPTARSMAVATLLAGQLLTGSGALSVTLAAGSSVADSPSMRTVTVGPANATDAPSAANTTLAQARANESFFARRRDSSMEPTPFHEGLWAFGRRLVSWLPGLPLRAFPSR